MTIEICGRIPYSVVWDYFNKLRTSRTTDLIIVRFHIQQEADKPAYAALFQYFHSRKRIGVVGNNRPHVKDMYLLPLAAQDPVPVQIQPFNGPGKYYTITLYYFYLKKCVINVHAYMVNRVLSG